MPRERRRGIIRKITLPSQPPAVLDNPIASADFAAAHFQLFRFFGIDPSMPNADRRLWLALATCIFPSLASPLPVRSTPRKRGRPQKAAPKYGRQRYREVAIAFDACFQRLRLSNASVSEQSAYTYFKRQNPSLAQVFSKNDHGNIEPIQWNTFRQILNIGRKLLNEDDIIVDFPPAFHRLPLRAQNIYKRLEIVANNALSNLIAVSYPGMTRPNVSRVNITSNDIFILQSELLNLDFKRKSDLDRLNEIEAEVGLRLGKKTE